MIPFGLGNEDLISELELFVGFKSIKASFGDVDEEFVSVLSSLDDVGGWEADDLEDFRKLVILRVTWKNGNAQKQLGRDAS